MPGRPDPVAELVALVVLDGWGCAPPGPGNAVELASTPVFDRLWREYPHGHLAASGEAVGLPDGQMGNSEVGHLTIGSGRILFQDLQRVNLAIRDGSLQVNIADPYQLPDGAPFPIDVPYAGYLLNGKTPADPARWPAESLRGPSPGSTSHYPAQ